MRLREIRAEMIKLSGRRLFWLMPALAAGVVIITMAFMYSALKVTEGKAASPPGIEIEVKGGAAQDREAATRELRNLLTLPDSVGLGVGVGSLLGLLLMVVAAAEITGDEIKNGAVCQPLLSGQTRMSFILTKFVLLAAYALFLSVISISAALAMGGVFTRILAVRPEGVILSLRLAKETAGVTLRVAYMLLPYAFLAALTSLRGSTAIGVMTPLASFMILEPLVAERLLPLLGEAGAHVIKYLPRFAAIALLEGGAGAIRAALVLLAYCILFTCLTLALFRKRDVAF